MYESTIVPGDIVTAGYYTKGLRKSRKGKEYGEGTEKTGSFVVLDVTPNGKYIYGLMSLRNRGTISEPNHCFLYNDSYYVVLNMKYRISVERIGGVIYHLAESAEYNAITNAFAKYSEEHIVHDADERRQMSTDNSKRGSKTGFHMRYAPTSSITVVSGGSFGKK